MSDYKCSKVSEIAQIFGMTSAQFAYCIGYSRQALYHIAHCKSANAGRADLARRNLHNLSKQMRDEAVRMAEEEFQIRNKMVDEFFNVPVAEEAVKFRKTRNKARNAKLHREILTMSSASAEQKRISRAWLLGHGFNLEE